MIDGPKNDGTYIVEFRTADGEALAISVTASETRVLKHFQKRMPYGLFVPDVTPALIAKASRRHDKPPRRARPVTRAGMGRHLHHPAGRGGGHICTCPYSLEREAAMEASESIKLICPLTLGMRST
jgi:hypothetical protein